MLIKLSRVFTNIKTYFRAELLLVLHKELQNAKLQIKDPTIARARQRRVLLMYGNTYACVIRITLVLIRESEVPSKTLEY